MRVRLTFTAWAVECIAQAQAAAARVAAADAAARTALALRRRRESARASVRLDASPLSAATADDVDARLAADEPVVGGAAPRPPAPADAARALASVDAGWTSALHLDGMATQEVAAVEYANAIRAAEAEPELASRFLRDPAGVRTALHAALADGLVAPRHVGRLRVTTQAVHDGAQGHVLYRVPDPDELPGLLTSLDAWVAGPSAALPAIAAATVVEQRVLSWHPYDAANGRLARGLARVTLQARGLDPDGLAAPAVEHGRDPGAYHAEIAATAHRGGDLSGWTERVAEAVARSLDTAATQLDGHAATREPARSTVTLREFAVGAGIGLAEARRRLERARAEAGADVVPGSHGLRWSVDRPTGPREPLPDRTA